MRLISKVASMIKKAFSDRPSLIHDMFALVSNRQTTMYCKCAFFVCFLLNFEFPGLAQDCRTYGQPCFDDDSCCGSCCLKGSCKDTYLDCRATPVEDPCTNRHCPDGQVCYTYQPTGCTGCGLLVECRALPVPEELAENKTLTHHHHFSAAGPLRRDFLPIFGLCFLALWF